VHTDFDVQADDIAGVADLGGSVVTGVDGNPLAVLASQLGIPMYRIQAEPEDCPLYRSDGALVSSSTDQQVRMLPRNVSVCHHVAHELTRFRWL
jgi:hypothetical protein